ncbi:helicase-related protein [Microcoleus sp. FACHB-68]|uniref:helicase-related protein n=1 Tax=Microcoleus sp. FACHB-68 TaxID=2692826 RepID=UPI001687A46B|nr:helicase-related protein [Microcoleus sp. FACHB-68]MBD1936014.1 helicase [Microcoleus sp. FACHB-68]
MTAKIAEDLGRLFEVGFNIGILAYIKQNKIKSQFGDLYSQDLQQLKFAKMLKRIDGYFINPLARQMAEKWSGFFLQKGFLAGLNFFREYIQSNGWIESRHLEILYYQCKFCGDNSIGTYENKTNIQWFREVLSQFEKLTEDDIEHYIQRYFNLDLDQGKKGEFVNADTLILLRNRRQFRVFCVDLSVFSVKTSEDVQDLNYVEILRRLLIRDISYLKSKSVFSNLRIDAESLGLDFAEDLRSYFTAFKYHDKESAKLIQAAGYTHSFYEFLRETGIVKDEMPVIFNAVGYSDRGINAISVNREKLEVLKTCYQIYKHDSSPKQLNDARLSVLNKIKRSVYGSFDRGKEFVDSLLAIPSDRITCVSHQEQVDRFFNSVGEVPAHLQQQLGLSGTMNLKQAHAELIKKELESPVTYIFLTGNPGIGKTTAIVDFLKSEKIKNEGFLFFYVSPRKQVNLDIVEKFKDKETQLLCDDRLICLNTNADLIRDNNQFGRYTVQYLANHPIQGDFSVNFLDSRVIDRKNARLNRLKRPADDVIQDAGQKTRGVLNSICEAIYTLLTHQISTNIVATVSIQSLKKTDTGDTLKHFEKIFRDAYNEREGTVISTRMQGISSRIKHLFIMIDEITGDDGGVEFLQGIAKIISKYQLNLPQHGFNTKIIIADASIVHKDVITQHLEDTSAEPDKIYFRKVEPANLEQNSPSDPYQALSIQQFKFKGWDATAINANSYPASRLHISYKVFVESYKFREEERLKKEDNLTKNLQAEILTDIELLLNRSDVSQIIVYIQNKMRLSELIEKIKNHRGEFEKAQDYLEIHANISEEEKELIHKYKTEVKIIFMTASGSRGLSFPKAKHILVEISRFEIEQNLMEVIQVIYRGRGNDEIDQQEKNLIFYLGEQAAYFEDASQLSLQESVLNVLNILLILKTSIMTRIQGYGRIGRDNFLMIPVGGKSVSAAGETFSSQMASLIKALKKESHLNPKDMRLKQVYTSLERLLGNADFVVRNQAESNFAGSLSYLQAKEVFNRQFAQLAKDSLEQLLNLGNLEFGYMSGGLLIVPIAEKTLEETYLMRLIEITHVANDKLWKNMQYISHSNSYPGSLQSAIKNAIEFVKKLKEGASKTQRFEQNSQQLDQYYALPLFTFIAGESLKNYFADEPEEPTESQFRDILSAYICALYPAGNILPIGNQYYEAPFVLFRSYSLSELRNKLFKEKYLLNSHELNVLNLILSKET